MILSQPTLLHWNYFLAIESDLGKLSRYIEFATPNMRTYSIELAHLLLASSSEVDVVLKSICGYLQPDSKPANIHQYRKIIEPRIPTFFKQKVIVPRFGLTLQPWSTWKPKTTPKWWQSYNHVKHSRDRHFEDANLKNTLNAVAGLLVANFHVYKVSFSDPAIDNREITQMLHPESQLVRFPDGFYYSHLIV